MADERQGQSVTVIVALIGLVGVLGAAVISNWDKLAGKPQVGQAVSAPTSKAPAPQAAVTPPAVTPPVVTPAIQPAATDPPPAAKTPETPPAKTYPDFSGQWVQLGSQTPFRMTISQSGRQVTIDNRTLAIRDDGSFGYQMFAAGPSPGHTVNTAAEADLIDTFNYRLDGPTLVFTTIFDTRHPYGGDPVGVKTRVMKYMRE